MRRTSPSQGGEFDGDSFPKKWPGGSVEYSRRRFCAYVIYCTSALVGGGYAVQQELAAYSRKTLCETFSGGSSLRGNAERCIGAASCNCVPGGLQYADLLPTCSGWFAAGADENWWFQPSSGRGLQANARDAENARLNPAIWRQRVVQTRRQPGSAVTHYGSDAIVRKGKW